jgi:hypothetical protein
MKTIQLPTWRQLTLAITLLTFIVGFTSGCATAVQHSTTKLPIRSNEPNTTLDYGKGRKLLLADTNSWYQIELNKRQDSRAPLQLIATTPDGRQLTKMVNWDKNSVWQVGGSVAWAIPFGLIGAGSYLVDQHTRAPWEISENERKGLVFDFDTSLRKPAPPTANTMQPTGNANWQPAPTPAPQLQPASAVSTSAQSSATTQTQSSNPPMTASINGAKNVTINLENAGHGDRVDLNRVSSIGAIEVGTSDTGDKPVPSVNAAVNQQIVEQCGAKTEGAYTLEIGY